jgi:tRNA nucleotidyltransferase (CCA-adding enzyme)
MKDIKGKVLRVLHNLSFVEDPTRMFRAIRFEQRFNFRIGRLTLALIKNAAKMNILREPSHRRFFLELRLILKEQNPVRAIRRMDDFNLLQFISPEIRFTKRVERLLKEIRKVIDWYSLLYLEESFEPWKVYWHGLTSSLSISSLKALAEKNGMVNQDNRRMIFQRESMMKMQNGFHQFSGDSYQVYTLLSPYDTESLLYMMARTNSEKTKRLISNYFTKLKGTKILLRGKDLSNMGFQPGPIYRKIFDRVLEARLNDQIKTKQDEVRFVQEHFDPHRPERVTSN